MAWQAAIERGRAELSDAVAPKPAALRAQRAQLDDIRRGGYVLAEAESAGR